MASWVRIRRRRPWLAEAIRALYPSVRAGLRLPGDGAPRRRPAGASGRLRSITEGGLFCFVLDSPKRRDLERDGRYALHAFPPEDRRRRGVPGWACPRVHRPCPPASAWPRPMPRTRGGLAALRARACEVAMLARPPPVGRAPTGLRRPPRSVWRDPGWRRPGWPSLAACPADRGSAYHAFTGAPRNAADR